MAKCMTFVGRLLRQMKHDECKDRSEQVHQRFHCIGHESNGAGKMIGIKFKQDGDHCCGNGDIQKILQWFSFHSCASNVRTKVVIFSNGWNQKIPVYRNREAFLF